MQLHQFAKSSSNREGVALNKDLNVEALFITLKKSEKEYSPSTLYDDYAISDTIFHWQSQNATSSTSSKGKSYIQHTSQDKEILIFVREQNNDQFGNTMGYDGCWKNRCLPIFGRTVGSWLLGKRSVKRLPEHYGRYISLRFKQLTKRLQVLKT